MFVGFNSHSLDGDKNHHFFRFSEVSDSGEDESPFSTRLSGFQT